MVNSDLRVQLPESSLLLVVVGLVFAGMLYASAAGRLPGIYPSDNGHDHDDHAHDHDGTQTASGDVSLRDRFAVLRTKSTNACGARPQHLSNIPDGQRMQGSCCSQMVFHSYKEQIAGLKANYSEYGIIPKDPYNVSVKWAKQMIEYGEESELTAEQQTIYDEAKEISHEGGPCCCICWHWYAYSGLAEKLIVEHDFTAEQVAQVWDLSDACGGRHSHA